MKILVVDDEYYARKAMAKIISRCAARTGETCDILESASALAALAACGAVHIDLVFTDIQMPAMDGIELCERLRAQFPALKLVIVSGHAEFDYARRAIKSGICEYLTKPVDEDEMLRILQRCAEEKREAEHEAMRRELTLTRLRYSEISERLARLISRPAGERNVPPLSEILCMKREVVAYYIVIITPKNPENTLFITEALNFIHQIKTAEHGAVFWIDKHPNDTELVVLHYPTDISKHAECSRLLLWSDIGAKQFSLALSIGVSAAHSGAAQLGAAYVEARRALAHAMIQSRQNVYLFEDLADRQATVIVGTPSRQLLSNYLLEGRVALVKQTIRTLFDTAVERGDISVFDFREGLVEVALLLNKYAKQHAPDNSRRLCVQVEQLMSCLSYDAAVESLLLAVDRIFSGAPGTTHENRDIAGEIRRYLDVSYAEDINLYDLAQNKFFMHPNYLSRIFKLETGMSFSKYLLKVRMEKARALILSGESRVSDVAQLVGYNSAAHFVQMYKKYYGYTPSQSKRGAQ